MKNLQPKTISYEEYNRKVKGLKTAGDVTSFVKDLIAPALQAILEAEMTEHLGYAKYEGKGKNSGNSRNGHSEKLLKTSFGNTPLTIPRDRNAEFVPQIVGKHVTVQSDVEDESADSRLGRK